MPPISCFRFGFWVQKNLVNSLLHVESNALGVMTLFNRNGSLNEEMVLLMMHQSPVTLMNSLLLVNELASSMSLVSPFDCTGNLQKKRLKKANEYHLLASNLREALLRNFPTETISPHTYPVWRMETKIPRASFNFTIKLKSKFGEQGFSIGHFSFPHGFCLGPEDDIVVADSKNHRIQVFEKNGVFKYKFGYPGKEDGFLWVPRKIALMTQSESFVVGDKGAERSRLQLFSRFGYFLRRISIPYIEILAGLAVTPDGRIIAVDSVEPTVYILHQNGYLLHMFNCRHAMMEPSEVAIRGSEIFLCDFKGHCVTVFSERGEFLRRFGGPHLTNYPNGIEITSDGQVLVGDSHGNFFHLVAFTREGDLLVEFECPAVRVSRCCGLKITSEGYVVTAAKNNHHMIVTERLCDGRNNHVAGL